MQITKTTKLIVATVVLALATSVTVVQLREVQVPRVMEMSDHSVAVAIRALEPGEKLTLRINSYGGEATSAMEIMNALELTKGEVTGEIDGMAASAAGIILAKVSHIAADPHSIVLIHSVVDANGNKLNEGDPVIAWMNAQLKEAVLGILTPEEIYEVFTLHKDLWIEGHVFQQRFDALKAGKGQSTEVFVPTSLPVTTPFGG